MQESLERPVFYKLRYLTAERRLPDNDLKLKPSLYGSADNATLRVDTRWTMFDLPLGRPTSSPRARANQPSSIISFLTAQRLRRFGQDGPGPLWGFRQRWRHWSVESCQAPYGTSCRVPPCPPLPRYGVSPTLFVWILPNAHKMLRRRHRCNSSPKIYLWAWQNSLGAS